MKHMLQICCKNNNISKEFPIGSTLLEIYQDLNLDFPYQVVSAKVNNRSEGLNFRVYNNKDVEFLDVRAPSGMRTYVRSLCFILYKAVRELFPQGKLYVEHPVSKGYFCNLRIGRPIELADVTAIKQRMREIIAGKPPFQRRETGLKPLRRHVPGTLQVECDLAGSQMSPQAVRMVEQYQHPVPIAPQNHQIQSQFPQNLRQPETRRLPGKPVAAVDAQQSRRLDSAAYRGSPDQQKMEQPFLVLIAENRFRMHRNTPMLLVKTNLIILFQPRFMQLKREMNGRNSFPDSPR